MTNAMGWLESAFLHVIHISWQAALLALLIGITQYLLRNLVAPGWRHALWGLLLARLLLFWTLPAPFSIHNVPAGALLQVTAYRLEAGTPAQRLPVDTSAVTGASAIPFSGTRSPETLNVDRGMPPSETAAMGKRWPLLSAMAVLWLAGASLMIGVLLVRGVWLKTQESRWRAVTNPAVSNLIDECKRRIVVSTQLAVLETSYVSGPALMGILRPRLLIPAGLFETASREHLRHIILHELVHVKRKDILCGWLFDLLLALHWFNPVLWWARRRIAIDRELACDAQVLSVLTPEERPVYGHALLDQFQRFVRPAWYPGLAGVLEGRTQMERRIAMITRYRKPSTKNTFLALAILCVLGILALTDAQEATPKNENPPANPATLAGPILAGRGLEEVGVGDMRDAVIGVLGAPERDSEERWLKYRLRYGLDFILSMNDCVAEMRFNPGFRGKTTGGAGIGDSLDKAIGESGGALKTVQADSPETHGVTKGTDRVLYEKKDDGHTTSAFKFIDAKRGILYWADENKRITQIVVFNAQRPDWPTTVVVFAAKGDFIPQDSKELLAAFNENFPRDSGCRTHHYRALKVNDAWVGFICADKPEPILEMLANHPKLAKLHSWRIESDEAFAAYLGMSDEERLQIVQSVLSGAAGQSRRSDS